MPTDIPNRVLQQLREADGRTDAELLDHYVTRRDEAAFEGLVRRHGPMVLGVCRRVLGNHADADDAFQATFLVLVRKARSVRARSLVANWLYGVAHNVALKAQAMNRQRRTKEEEAGTVPRPEPGGDAWAELQGLLDSELSRLPDRYRVPIVLCDLEGQTIQGAARHLGWPQGTTATRLSRGRALLARRLARHGVKLSAVALTVALSHRAAPAEVPAALALSTTRAAHLWATGPAAAGEIPARAAALAEAAVRSMLLAKLKAATASLLAVTLVGAVGWLTYGAVRAGPTGAPGDGPSPAAAPPNGPAATDRDGPPPGPVGDDAGRRHLAWQKVIRDLRRDPTLVVYYTFEPEPDLHKAKSSPGWESPSAKKSASAQRTGTLRNQADAGKSAHDGEIFGCSWVTGRWPGKRALEFKQVTDRVRLNVPKEFPSVTLVAWVRVDALTNNRHSLIMTDGWSAGAVHWQIADKGKLVLAVKPPDGPGEAAWPPKPADPPKGEVVPGPAVFGPARLGKWTQLAAVYDRKRGWVTHYVDGRPAWDTEIPANAPLRFGDAEIGNWNPAGRASTDSVRNLNGRMDEFLLFSRALSKDDIGWLFAVGRPPD